MESTASGLDFEVEQREVIDLTKKVKALKRKVVKPEQEKMVKILDLLGIMGVRRHLLEYGSAMYSKHGNKSWDEFRRIAQEYKTGGQDWIFTYLATMDQEALRGFISGNLMARKYEEVTLRRKLEESHSLVDTPQVYVCISHRAEFGGQSTQGEEGVEEPKGGWGPSVDRMVELLDAMGRYADVNCQHASLFKKIDEAFVERKEKRAPRILNRRYLRTETAAKKIKEWVDSMKNKFRTIRSDMDEAERFADQEWTMCEVGFGERGHARATEHIQHESTNYLFGLYTAVLKSKWPGEYTITPFALFDVLEPAHANFCEVLGSLLVGSYGIYSGFGLNPALAGGLSLGDGPKGLSRSAMDSLWQENRKRFTAKKSIKASMDTDAAKRAKLTDDVDDTENLDELKEKAMAYEHQIAALQYELTQLKEQKEAMDDLEDALDEVLSGK
ncbi:hypothetical protein LTR70_004317 [Exophiala xenobiotica]|uniref:Uncharacterized protein n=1 Tax=Lithohypha guttulata TaxID=1690604 RepID=A0ABR0KDU7_9EURO|nr:hypothetical protein LTR24_003718 [Lithohypha guttulata]KAK5321072.1 hypothetical protein LTR70_004317 [Exophiala xenobiotica]